MKKIIQIAQSIDLLRVFPRLFLTVFFIAYCLLAYASWQWYTLEVFPHWDKIGPANLGLLTAFPVSLLSALGGMFTSMYKHYQAYKPPWRDRKDGS